MGEQRRNVVSPDRKVSIACGVFGRGDVCGEVTEVASGSVEAAGTTLFRAIGDSCPIAK